MRATLQLMTHLETNVYSIEVGIVCCRLECAWMLPDIQGDQLTGAVPNEFAELQKASTQDDAERLVFAPKIARDDPHVDASVFLDHK